MPFDYRTLLHITSYNGGLRALKSADGNLVGTGGYLNPKGNDFWGVKVFVRDGQTYILGSDRDSGL
ncbi:MAG: hypothetical protein HZB51_32630 [Chloroflexi bacterium]|nr:hypothetical protein [Chloroflexota bacterium]